MIFRVRYRIGKDPSYEIIATEKICLKKMKALKEQHGNKIKFSKMVHASNYPRGAPHI